MSIIDPPLTSLDNRQLGLLQETVKASDSKYDGVLVSSIAIAASNAAKAGDVDGERALHFLTRLLSIPINGLDRTPPVSVATLRLAAEPDPQEVEVAKQVLDRLSTPAAKARISDLLWRWTEDYRFAEMAVQAYFDAGAPFETPAEWPSCTDRYKRAVQLAASLGKGRPLFANAVERIRAALQRWAPGDVSFLTRELIQILLDYKQGDPKALASIAEAVAHQLEAAGKFFQAREYWGAVEDCHSADADQAGRRSAITARAEAFVKQAQSEPTAASPSYLRASSFIRDAIGILDKLQPDSRGRIAELRILLADYGERARSEMKPLTLPPIDLSDVARDASARVSGKSPEEGLNMLTMVTMPPTRRRLEAAVREAVKNFPFQHMFPLRVISSDGGVVGGRPGIDPHDPDDSPLFTEMVRQALVHYAVSSHSTIDPARRTLLAEHAYHERDLARLAEASPFVPPGREPFFSRGLFAGLEGDYFLSTHVLVPQIEHAIRHLLKKRGVNTVAVKSSGLDEERDLGDLLRVPEATQILGEDTCFNLRALLLHRSGPHFRDLLAHGLLEYGAFFSVHACYLWWLTLRLCVLFIPAKQMPRAPDSVVDTHSDIGPHSEVL